MNSNQWKVKYFKWLQNTLNIGVEYDVVLEVYKESLFREAAASKFLFDECALGSWVSVEACWQIASDPKSCALVIPFVTDVARSSCILIIFYCCKSLQIFDVGQGDGDHKKWLRQIMWIICSQCKFGGPR